MTTGEKLAFLRKERGITQEELAEMLGVSRQSISRWEMDIAFPETEKLIKLSKVYDCSIDFLLNNSLNIQEAKDAKITADECYRFIRECGYFGKEDNRSIAEKLRTAFVEWIDNGHNNFEDENTIILCIQLTDGVLFSQGTRYDIDFTK